MATESSQLERKQKCKELEAMGWGAAQVGFPLKFMEILGPKVDTSKVDLYFCGKSLSTLLGCQGICPITEIGAYSLPEIALANLLGIPTDLNKPWRIQQEHINQIKADNTPMLEHIDRLDLRRLMTRPMRDDEIRTLGDHSFWSAIPFYLYEGSEAYNGDVKDLIKYRLRKFFPERQEIPKLRDKIPDEHTDYRPALANIRGQGITIIQMFDWDDKGVWELDPKTFAARYLLRQPDETFIPTDRKYDAIDD